MKGSIAVLTVLDRLLAAELSAINQYVVHSEMLSNWGYGVLASQVKSRAIGEMKHAERLIERMLFLESNPSVSATPQVAIGADVEKMLLNDRDAELDAIGDYNMAIAVCRTEKDGGTEETLQEILADEEAHVNYIDAELWKIDAMGLPVYLTTIAD